MFCQLGQGRPSTADIPHARKRSAMSGTLTKVRHPGRVAWFAAVAVVLAGCQSESADTDLSPIVTTRASAAAAYGPAGAFDVGGHKLDLICRGAGTPTIVFENGLGDTSTTWSVPDGLDVVRIADSFPSVRTCVYTRLNLGRSDHVKGTHTGADSVRDLHTLLDVAKVPGPYLLVGHSFGGLLALMYAATHPADVVGLVLLDPTLNNSAATDALFSAADLAEWTAAIAMSPEKADVNVTLEQAAPLMPKVPNVPVLLLISAPAGAPPSWSAAKTERIFTAISKDRQGLVDALPQGELRRVDTGHYIHRDEPQLGQGVTTLGVSRGPPAARRVPPTNRGAVHGIRVEAARS